MRAGTGGDEAAIFAGDLFRMYQRFAEGQGWRFEVEGIESAPLDVEEQAPVEAFMAVALDPARLEAHRAWTDGFAAFRAEVADGRVFSAYDSGRRLGEWLGGDEEYEVLWQQVTTTASIRTSPGNATVSVQDYATPDGPWVTLGQTPFSITLSGPAPGATDNWAVPRLVLREATRQTGHPRSKPPEHVLAEPRAIKNLPHPDEKRQRGERPGGGG